MKVITNSKLWTFPKSIDFKVPFNPKTWYRLTATLNNGIARVFVDGREIGNNVDTPFLGRFFYQENGVSQMLSLVGTNSKYIIAGGSTHYLSGKLRKLKFHNKAIPMN